MGFPPAAALRADGALSQLSVIRNRAEEGPQGLPKRG
jgi:hypothetical protein